ncbi:hypothetical protein [Nonomuraea typhae]|uniref:Uncharacterized protein n=1 Tax=Nonomuraea typhae TaxID=2603600 RepID=A0ABW7YJC0_9ACTN
MKYQVNQEVRIFDVNRERDRVAEGRLGAVTHVGRKLVTVQQVNGLFEVKYRMDTGRINDAYGHEYILTLDEVEERNRKIMLNAKLQALGIGFRPGFERKYSAVQLETVVKALEEGP